MSATEYPSFIVRSSTGPTLPWRPRSTRLETLALALGICLPVPVFAALGLSLPLPNVVERIAAALVPWADSATLEAGELGASGSIVPAAADARPSRGSARVPGASAATPFVKQRSGPATRTANPLAGTPASRPAATGGVAPAPTARPGGADRPGTAPTAEGDAPARHPEAQPKPAETPTKPASGPAGVTENVPAPAPLPTVPSTPAPPAPIPSAPIPSSPVPLPAPVQQAVDDVVAVAADPVGTVGGIVPAPGGTLPPAPPLPLPVPVPLPLPRLGK